MISILATTVLLAQSGNNLTAPVEAPFKITESAIIVDALINGKPASFMFDTGFSGYITISDQINIGKATGTIMLRDFVGQFAAKTVPISSIHLGNLKQDKIVGAEAVQQEASHYTESYGTHCDGIMGFSVVKDFITEINFEKGKFVFHPRTVDITKRTPDNKKTFLVKLEPKGVNSMELTVTKNGKEMHLALDTGNGFYATTHKEVLERIGVWDPNQKPKFVKQASVASGVVDSFYMWMNDIEIYGVPVKSSIWSIIDLPSSSAEHDGTVGFGFLKHFNITIDYERRYVWLENWTGKTADDFLGEPGIIARQVRQGRYRILRVWDSSPAAKAGILVGDDLLAIDGKSLSLVSPHDVDTMLEGPPGKKVKLTISRDGILNTYEVDRKILANGTPPSE